ncbi:hypothetical protein AJ78_09043, partial [Emergomyces pasteurianus Ep9510]
MGRPVVPLLTLCSPARFPEDRVEQSTRLQARDPVRGEVVDYVRIMIFHLFPRVKFPLAT